MAGIINDVLEGLAVDVTTTINAGTHIVAGTNIDSIVGNITAHLGHLVAQSGNLRLPITNAAGTMGCIDFGGFHWIHNYGTSNTFVGQSAGNTSLTVASAVSNTIIGKDSGAALTTGDRNSCCGASSLSALTQGQYNAVLGQASLNKLTTGNNNTVAGRASLNQLVSGSYNTVLGCLSADNYTTNESSNIIIGSNVTGTVGESNLIRIGNNGGGASQQNRCFIAGIYGITPTTAAATALPLIDSAGQLGSLGLATNGQIPIGSTGAAPVLATIGAGAGIAVTNGAGSISIGSVGGGLTWTAPTVDAGITVQNGYIANKAGLLTMTLPATAALGDVIEFTNLNTAVGLRIAQNANQSIRVGTSTTAVGVGGYIESTQLGDSIKLVCTVAGASTRWQALSCLGNWTIA